MNTPETELTPRNLSMLPVFTRIFELINRAHMYHARCMRTPEDVVDFVKSRWSQPSERDSELLHARHQEATWLRTMTLRALEFIKAQGEESYPDVFPADPVTVPPRPSYGSVFL